MSGAGSTSANINLPSSNTNRSGGLTGTSPDGSLVGMSAPGLVKDLAAWVSSVTLETLPPGTLHAARRLVLDRLGISLGGTRLLGVHPTARLALPGTPSATVWATGQQAYAPYAALANGCAGDGLELLAGPDCVEGAWAAAEIADRTLGDLLVAVVAGAEVGGYLRRWLADANEKHGLHHPATLGSLSVAAAAGRVLGLAEDHLAGALAGAACLMPRAPFGAFSGGGTAKSLFGGWPHQLGLWACLWAQDGMVGPSTALEGSRGVAQSLLDAGGIVQAPAFAPGSGGWEIERVLFKAIPACRSVHPAVTALESLGPLDVERVRAIRVWTYPYAVDLDTRSHGEGIGPAQVSVKQSVALALVSGGLAPGVYTPAALEAPAVQRLATLTTVEVGQEYAGDGPRVRGARIEVTLDNGQVLAARTDEPRWGASAPAMDAELRARFQELVASTDAAGAAVLGTVAGLDLLDAPTSTPIRALTPRRPTSEASNRA
jgi:2-methylcitrate dehydratase PrpD